VTHIQDDEFDNLSDAEIQRAQRAVEVVKKRCLRNAGPEGARHRTRDATSWE
jgi:hypothetical protein